MDKYLGLTEILAELGEKTNPIKDTGLGEAWLKFYYCITQNQRVYNSIIENPEYSVREKALLNRALPVLTVRQAQLVAVGEDSERIYDDFMESSRKKAEALMLQIR